MKVNKKAVEPTFDIEGLTLKQMQHLIAALGGVNDIGCLYPVMVEGANALGNDRKWFQDLFKHTPNGIVIK